MKKYLGVVFLGLIILAGLILRIVRLGSNPPALSWDEISHGYNAYSILKTGADDWGQKFPILNFRAYGDYPLPLNLYLTIPSIFLLGLTEFSIRLPHALLGTLLIPAVYFLALGLTKRKSLSAIAALLFAVEPWALFTSRIVLQQNLSVFLVTLAGAAFFNREKEKALLPISFLLFFLGLFAYHSTRIFAPMLLVGALFVYRREFMGFLKKGSYRVPVAVISILGFLVLSALIILQPEARARGKWLFLINETAINRIIEKRENSELPREISRFIYNRPTYFATEFGKNFVGYLSPQFLFLNGGTQYQYSLPFHGLSYPINLPFFYIGLVLIILRALKGSKDFQFILAWLLFSLVPGSITNEVFAVTRASTMLPLPQILSSLGLFWAYDYFTRKTKGKGKALLAALYLFALIFFVQRFLVSYFRDYPQKYSQSWQYGYKEAVAFAKESYAGYDKIIVTKKYGEPHEFFLFFWPWDPASYKNDKNLIRYYQSNWYWVDAFDKFYFVNDWQIPESGESFILESKKVVGCEKQKCLLVTSPGNYPLGWKKLKTINFLDGSASFEIYEN